MAEQPPNRRDGKSERCDATWALPSRTDACEFDRAIWGPLEPSLEFMMSGLSGLVEVCGAHQSALHELQRSNVNQDSTLWPLYWGSCPEPHPSPEIQAVQWFVADVNANRLRYLDAWQTETNALIEQHGVEAVEQHMVTVREGHRSTTMLDDVPVHEQLMIAKMVCDVIAASKQ